MTHIMTTSAAQILERRREDRLVKKWMGTDVEGTSRALNYTWELSLNVPKLRHRHYPGMSPKLTHAHHPRMSPNLHMRTIPECPQTYTCALSRKVPKLTHEHYPGMYPNWYRRTIPECARTDTDALFRNVFGRLKKSTETLSQESWNSRQVSNSKTSGSESQLLLIIARLPSSGGKQYKNSWCLLSQHVK
jgi:hypothetical protein